MESWGTSQFDITDRQRYVANIRLCAYENVNNEGDANGRPPTNHWAVFLELYQSGSKYVNVDMIPGDGADGLTGTIILESKSYSVTNTAIKTVTFQPIKWTTVEAITDLIVRNRRDKYKFTEHEEGCRYWVYTFILDLENEGIVAPGSATTVWASVSCYWRYPSGCEERAVELGTFQ